VSAVLEAALTGKAVSTMHEGERLYDITLVWPAGQRSSAVAILDLPVDVSNDQVVPGNGPVPNAPRLRLRDLVTSVGERPGAVAIYRDQGKRVLPVRFCVHGRPLAAVRAEAAPKIAPLLHAPYRVEWGD
jgi:cobalt-zinc-cadmium resistance protein CzcA